MRRIAFLLLLSIFVSLRAESGTSTDRFYDITWNETAHSTNMCRRTVADERCRTHMLRGSQQSVKNV